MRNFSTTPLIQFQGGIIPYSPWRACPLPNTQFNDAFVTVPWDNPIYTGKGVTIDLSNQTGGQPPIDQILSVFIDNLDVSQDVYAVFPDTGFVAHCPPYSSKFTNVVTNNRTVQMYAGTAGRTSSLIGTTKFHFLNALENPFVNSQESGNALPPALIYGQASNTGAPADNVIHTEPFALGELITGPTTIIDLSVPNNVQICPFALVTPPLTIVQTGICIKVRELYNIPFSARIGINFIDSVGNPLGNWNLIAPNDMSMWDSTTIVDETGLQQRYVSQVGSNPGPGFTTNAVVTHGFADIYIRYSEVIQGQ